MPCGARSRRTWRRRLERWAGWLAEPCQNGREAFACFNIDVDGAATRDAARLREMLAGRCRRDLAGDPAGISYRRST
jgi:hypothetical protein